MISPPRSPRAGTELIVVLGAGGHGKVVADALSLTMPGKVSGFIDCNRTIVGSRVLGLPVLEDQEWLFREGGRRQIPVALGVGNVFDRQRLLSQCVESGLEVLTVVHPHASIAASAEIGTGSVLLAQAVLNADSKVGRGVIINTAAIVEHDVEVGDFTHLAPNATTGGGVRIGTLCHIGLGAQILPGVAIGSGTSVGAGAVVLHELPANAVAVGNPARILRKRSAAAER